MPTLDLEAKAKALGAYKETAFVKPDTSKIYDNLSCFYRIHGTETCA